VLVLRGDRSLRGRHRRLARGEDRGPLGRPGADPARGADSPGWLSCEDRTGPRPQTRKIIGEFIEAYNNEWLIERHGHRTPAEVRRQLTLQAA